MLARLSACVLTCLVLSPLHAAEKAPDLGYDYQAMLLAHMKLVADGKGEEAVKALETNMVNAEILNADLKDNLKKKFAVMYGSGGKLLNHELVGYKRFTSRIYRFTAVSHYEKALAVYTFTLVKTVSGEWKISMYSVTDGFDELEKVTPFVPIG